MYAPRFLGLLLLITCFATPSWGQREIEWLEIAEENAEAAAPLVCNDNRILRISRDMQGEGSIFCPLAIEINAPTQLRDDPDYPTETIRLFFYERHPEGSSDNGSGYMCAYCAIYPRTNNEISRRSNPSCPEGSRKSIRWLIPEDPAEREPSAKEPQEYRYDRDYLDPEINPKDIEQFESINPPKKTKMSTHPDHYPSGFYIAPIETDLGEDSFQKVLKCAVKEKGLKGVYKSRGVLD